MASTVPPPNPVHLRLTELREAMLRLHKTLLDSERAFYEHEIGRIHTANQLLALVLHDPWFAWLHELSQLVVVIDETLESEEPVSGMDADRLVTQSRALLVPSENGGGFAQHYFQALQRDPDVVIVHGETTRVLARLA